ncbi:hypothetical protein D9M71_378900 [compost metagenome]
MADVDDDLPRQYLGDHFHRQVLAQLVDHTVDGHLGRALKSAIQHGHVELGFFVLDAVRLGLGGRVHRNHAAILRHVLGKLGGADLGGGIDDVLLVADDQRTQHQRIGHPIDHREVRQGLAGHLGDRLAGHQRVQLQALGHAAGGAQHHALEGDTHVAVVDLGENLADHFLERHADEQHALRAAELLP